jgi:hypothetical protein
MQAMEAATISLPLEATAAAAVVVRAMIPMEVATVETEVRTNPLEGAWAATSLPEEAREVINLLVEAWEVTSPPASKVALAVEWSSSSSRRACKLPKALPRAKVGDESVKIYDTVFSNTSSSIKKSVSLPPFRFILS